MNKYALPGNPVQERADYVVNHTANKLKSIDKEILAVNYRLSSEGAESIEILKNEARDGITIIRIDGLSFKEIDKRIAEVIFNDSGRN